MSSRALSTPAKTEVPCKKNWFMVVGVPKESFDLERRVSQTPESVRKLIEEGFNVKVQAGAGEASMFSDDMYKAAGATITDSAGAWGADVVTHIHAPTPAEAAHIRDRTLLSKVWPSQNKDQVAEVLRLRSLWLTPTLHKLPTRSPVM